MHGRAVFYFAAAIAALFCVTPQWANAAEICRSKAADGSDVFADCTNNSQTPIEIDAANSNSYRSPEAIFDSAVEAGQAPLTTTRLSPDTPIPSATPAQTPEQVPAEDTVQIAPTPPAGPPALGSPELVVLLDSRLTKDAARLAAIQREYDAQCESARESKLAPERELIVQELSLIHI